MSPRTRLRATLATFAVAGLGLTTAACNLTVAGHQIGGGSDAGTHTRAAAPGPVQSPSPSPVKSAATITSNLPQHGTVPVDKTVALTAHDGTLTGVQVTYGTKHATLPGKLSADGSTWTAGAPLEPGVRYQVHAAAKDAKGIPTMKRSSFRSDPLTLDQQTFPSIYPLEGQTVGVGMPVIVKFDVPVTDHASIERHLHVVSTPHQVGSWHWISDNEVHWRPKHYWRAGSTVTVNANIDSVPAGNGIYGQLSRSATFHVGPRMIDRINLNTDHMKVYRDGTLLRTIPVSGGMPGFLTRSGTKVIIEKDRHIRMTSASIGITDKNSPNYYNLPVDYAMRVTFSGEFLHAAPWQGNNHGVANVSHGCVGMSTADAAWLFNRSEVGDVVQVTGSHRYMTLTNGYGDWNESFAQYKQGSALH